MQKQQLKRLKAKPVHFRFPALEASDVHIRSSSNYYFKSASNYIKSISCSFLLQSSSDVPEREKGGKSCILFSSYLKKKGMGHAIRINK